MSAEIDVRRDVILSMSKTMTLEQIAKDWKLTRERVRQIIEEAGGTPRSEIVATARRQERNKVKSLLKKGLSLNAIVGLTDIKYNRVYSLVAH